VIDRFKARLPLVSLVAAYYVGFVAVGIAAASDQTMFYALLMPVFVVVVAAMDARRPLPSAVVWGLALWGALHMAGGLVPASDDRVLYNVWLLPFVRFDHVVHAIGFGFAGLAFHATVSGRDTAGPGPVFALVFFGGVAIGGLNEMIEFLITRVREDTNIGGFENTGWDLVANTVGAAVAGLWARGRSPSGPPQ